MKMKNYSLMFLCSTLFLISCSKDGADGKTTLTRTTKEAAGANCQYGGTKFETGIDANNNGTLDDNEVTTTQTKYVCNGAGATYSVWIDVNVVDSTIKALDDYYLYQSIPAAALTADIVNKGTVLMYYKTKKGTVLPIDRDSYYGFYDESKNGNLFWLNAGFAFREKNIDFVARGNKDGMNDNESAVRYVLIPGMVQGRSMNDLKKMPYSEVAKLYNITD
jgi:hypothetical protein